MRATGLQAILATLLTFDDVCEMLGKSERSVRHYHTNCGLPATRIGGTLYFEVEKVEQWAESREVGPKGRFKSLVGDDEIGG